MTIEQMDADIRAAAEQLARANMEDEPAIARVYLFPSDHEIRLVEVDETMPPLRNGETITPFYFGASPDVGIRFRSAIALIRPEEAENAPLPPGWGDWGDADLISERR